MENTIIQELGECGGKRLFIKRDDLIPFSFGGNKARKAALFFREIDEQGCDWVVSYGSSSSNHGRVVANACAQRGLGCTIVSPEEASEPTFNSRMMALFGAEIVTVPVRAVHDTIEQKLEALRRAGHRPYFIPGGGHGNIGTEAYVRCYREICAQEAAMGLRFDAVFLASGTGTTQAGLVCGQLLAGDERRIVGISIARRNPYGRGVVLESVRSYLGPRANEGDIQARTLFLDSYTAGYGGEDDAVKETIRFVLRRWGIPLDATYTGKAFRGMLQCLPETPGENVLFLHTGGTPLFFDTVRNGL